LSEFCIALVPADQAGGHIETRSGLSQISKVDFVESKSTGLLRSIREVAACSQSCNYSKNSPARKI